MKFDDVNLNKLYYEDESEHKWKLAFGDNKNVHGKYSYNSRMARD